MDNIVFEDHSVQVLNVIKETAIAWLHEASGEIITQTTRNYDSAGRVDTGKTKGSFTHHVDDGELKSSIGSPDENAIWEEYGTGIYAENGNGRKTSWVYKDPKTGNFYTTRGKKGHRPFQHAYDSKQSTIIRMAEKKFGNNLK